jgi:transcriptional regulator with XRE-family HTH domain
MDRNSFWERTIRLIKAHKMTREQFTAYIGVPLRTFEGWIHKNLFPDVQTAADMATALGVSLDYLVRGTNRKITDKRLIELASRQAAARITELTIQIQKEAALIRNGR